MTAPAPAWYQTGVGTLAAARVHWKSVAGFGLLGAVVATVTVLLLPPRFSAGASFQAENPTPAALGGGLAGLASQIGGLQLTTQSNALLLGDLLQTEAVLRRVARATYPWEGSQAPLATVYRLDDKPDGLRDMLTVRRLRKALATDVNIRTGVVGFSVQARTPQLALALAETLLVALNEANIALRQTRAAAEQTFSGERAEDARAELTRAEDALADFYQRNRIINSPTLQMEETRLRRVADMAQQLYIQLRLQQEQAAVQAVRNTPAISVVDPPILPAKKSWPKRRAGVMAGLVVGLALGFARVAWRSSQSLR
jgi:uncharacterized protein involved in exopolysaccharide biosynthesis